MTTCRHLLEARHDRTAQTSTKEAVRRQRLLRRGLRLEYTTLGWNVIAIGFLVYAAITARSVALAGLALDSLVEIFASVVVVWRLKSIADPDKEQHAVRLSSWVHPTGQKSIKCPQVEGRVIRLSGRHAKLRREGYRKNQRR